MEISTLPRTKSSASVLPQKPFNKTRSLVRDSNIELLRIVLMGMIITHHLILHGCELSALYSNKLPINTSSYIKLFINSFVIFGVNTFVFISGYYGIKFKLSTLISLLLQAAFYSVVIDFTYQILVLKEFNYRMILSFFPFSRCVWWFFTVYLALYLFSPILNKSVDGFTETQLRFLVIVFLVINCFSGYFFNGRGVYVTDGYSIFSFITIYMTGRYLSKFYRDNKSSLYYFTFYVMISLMVFLMVFLLVQVGKQNMAGKLFNYNNPLIVLSSICFFYTFRNIQLQSKWVNSIAPLVFGVYLIHDHGVIRSLMIEKMKIFSIFTDDLLIFYTSLLLVALAIFITCCVLEKIRTLVFKPILQYIFELTIFKKIEISFGEKMN